MNKREQQTVQRAIEIIGRSFTAGQPMTSPSDVKRFLILNMAADESESFRCLWLNTQHQIIGFETLFTGTIDSCGVYPREVAKRALQLNAAAVIFAHNHPSGSPEPSQSDQRITNRLRDALALIDVRTIDHIIVGGNLSVSMAERGLL